jgi:hypothetical protein
MVQNKLLSRRGLGTPTLFSHPNGARLESISELGIPEKVIVQTSHSSNQDFHPFLTNSPLTYCNLYVGCV